MDEELCLYYVEPMSPNFNGLFLTPPKNYMRYIIIFFFAGETSKVIHTANTQVLELG